MTSRKVLFAIRWLLSIECFQTPSLTKQPGANYGFKLFDYYTVALYSDKLHVYSSGLDVPCPRKEPECVLCNRIGGCHQTAAPRQHWRRRGCQRGQRAKSRRKDVAGASPSQRRPEGLRLRGRRIFCWVIVVRLVRSVMSSGELGCQDARHKDS